MTIEQTTARSNVPATDDVLGTIEMSVTAGKDYLFRLPASDHPDKAGPRALVARIRFLDGAGNELSGAYGGCFVSERFGQYTYLATAAVESDLPSWSEQRVRAPEGALKVRVTAHRWRVSRALKVAGELQMTEASDALFDQEFEVSGGFPHRLYLALADTRPSDRAAVVQLVYFDAEGNEISGPYEGCNQSERFGNFTYAGTPKGNAREIRLLLRAPQEAVRAKISAIRWKGSRALTLAGTPRMEADVPDGLPAVRDWSPVSRDGILVPLNLPPGAAGNFATLRGQYMARHASGSASALRVVCEYLDSDGHPINHESAQAGVVGEPMLDFGNAAEPHSFACLTWCPPGATSARLRAYPGEGAHDVAIHRIPTLEPLARLVSASQMKARLGVALRADIHRPAFPEWRVRIAFEAMRVADPGHRDLELAVFFGDSRKHTMELAGIDTKVQAGSVRRAGKTLYLKTVASASGDPDVECLRASAQILPPPGVASITIRLSNYDGAGMPYTCVVEPCDALVDTRLSVASAAAAMRVEEHDHEAAEVMIQRLLARHPHDPVVLGGALDLYRRVGAATRMEAIASRALTLPKAPGKLRHKARHILASLQEQDPHWSIEVPGDWQGQPRRLDPERPLKVAHLFKTSVPYENTGGAIRCLNMVKFQKQAGMDPLVVTPLGYPSMNISGEPWECEDVEGVPHFRLNGIHRDDLRTIPSSQQLEYTALLTANLLREQGVDLVQASSGYRGYEQALVGLAVAKKLGVPFVYEVRSYHEHTWRPMAEWVLDAEFTRRRMAQEDRCMREADAVVTICETMKEGLVARGIPEEKIFVVPNSVDLDKFKPAAPDPELRSRIGLREGLVAGYISNISAREGHHVLLRGVAQARAAGTDLQCLIVGSGPELENLKQLVLELGIAEHVVFTGEVAHEDIPAYYALIDIFVVPRVADFASDYVTPMKPFEAMALGRPVLISDRPALREVVEPGVRGLEFRAGNVDDLSKRLIELGNSSQMRDQYAAAGRNWVENHRSWKTTINRYQAIYEHAHGANSAECADGRLQR